MNSTVQMTELKRISKAAASVVNSKLPPAFSAVWVSDGVARATNGDIDISIPTALPNGAIPLATLKRFLGAAKGTEAAIDDGKATVGKTAYRLYDMSAPWASMPERIEYRPGKNNKGEIEAPQGLYVDTAEFLAALRATEHAISTDPQRMALNGWGIDIDSTADRLTVVGVDGRRLARATAACFDLFNFGPRTVAIFQSGLAPLLWLFDGSAQTKISMCGVSHAGGVVTLSNPGTGARVTLRAIAGTFPNWRQVVPDVNWSHLACTVARSDVLEACKGALAMCDRDTVRDCGALLCDGWIGSEGAATAIDGLSVAVPVQLNASYLLDAVSAIASDVVTFHTLYHQPGAMDYCGPVCITSEGTFEILMPMRTEGVTAEAWNIPADVDLTAKTEPAAMPVEIGKVA
jgi:hypothetical protein